MTGGPDSLAGTFSHLNVVDGCSHDPDAPEVDGLTVLAYDMAELLVVTPPPYPPEKIDGSTVLIGEPARYG